MKEFLYSRNAVYEALRAGRRRFFRLLVAQEAQEKGRLLDILRLAQEHNLPIEHRPRLELDRILPSHQGVLLETGDYPYANLVDMFDLAHRHQQTPLILLLDALQDPQNLGTLLRTAEAVGVHGVIIPLARTATITPAVVNASSGACEHLLIARSNLVQAINEFKESGGWILGLDESASELNLESIPITSPLGVVVGNEGSGLRQLVRSKSDFLLKLPMEGNVESLNAAVAGSIALYLIYLARRKTSLFGG